MLTNYCMMHSLEAKNKLINAKKQQGTWDGRSREEIRLGVHFYEYNICDTCKIIKLSLFIYDL